MSSPKDQLRQLSEILFFSDNHKEIEDAVLKLYSLFSVLSGISDDGSDSCDSSSVYLPAGEAISPKDAARCVLDSVRTSKYLRAIRSALIAAQSRFAERPIEVLYAGCGPFAPLAIPLTTQFSAEQIQFTLVEIHSRSLQLAHTLIEAFALESYFSECEQVDAASYVHPRAVHLIIAEAMQQALRREPQVPITLNLAPQLCSGGIFVPERITIDAFLSNPQTELLTDRGVEPSVGAQEEDRIMLGRVFELTSDKAIELSQLKDSLGCTLPAATIELPTEIAAGLTLALSTTITLFQSTILNESESGITYPLRFDEFSRSHAGAKIEFHYILGEKPGFVWKTVSERNS